MYGTRLKSTSENNTNKQKKMEKKKINDYANDDRCKLM